MKIIEEMGLSFDDVLLVPGKSDIESRTDGSIDLSVQLTPNIKLKYPLIAAAMDSVCESQMANAMAECGGLGIIHRFMDDIKYEREFNRSQIKVAGIGLGESGLRRLRQLMRSPFEPPIAVHIDVAYAHTTFMLEFINQIKEEFPDIDIIVGSVATYDGVWDLCCAGVDAIRVGVGCGSKCSTRLQTGNGVPQITALIEARRAADLFEQRFDKRVSIICDGGVKDGGDVCKALAAGADAVMSGFLFAGTDETPGLRIIKDDKRYKCYRGMSSREAQQAWKGDRKIVSVEGVSSMVEYKGSVKDVFECLVGNILSGMSYQGAHNLKELQENAELIRMTPAGMTESKPRE